MVNQKSEKSSRASRRVKIQEQLSRTSRRVKTLESDPEVAVSEQDPDEGQRTEHEILRAERAEGSKHGARKLKDFVVSMLWYQKLDQENMNSKFMVKFLMNQKLKRDDDETDPERESNKNNRERFRTRCLPSERSEESPDHLVV